MDESKFHQQMLHHLIVPMGINAQVTALVEGPVYTECSNTLLGSIGCNPVHYAVRAFIYPVSVRYFTVGRLDVFAANKIKCADYFARIVLTDIAVTFFDIMMDQVFRRPARRSLLIRIACFDHLFPRIGIYLHHAFKILFCRFTYPHFYSHSPCATI